MQKYHTIKDIAESLQLSPKTVKNLIKKGEITVYQTGRQIRISEKDFENYMFSCRKVGFNAVEKRLTECQKDDRSI